ncbi:Nuclear RNA export factor 1 [Lamellibrachia satsuma]|nr:Nuclear RNA export factor 1 [Lamellibrachia satsuma]
MSEFKITSSREGSRSFGNRGGNSRGGRGGRGGQGGYDGNRGNRNYSGGGGYGGYSGSQGSRNMFKSRPRRQTGNYYRSRIPNIDGVNPLSRLGDDDDDMGDEVGKKQLVPRFNPYGGRQRPRGRNPRRGSATLDNAGHDALRRLGLPVTSSSRDRLHGNNQEPQRWKIIIPHGRSSEKDFIVKSITNMCNVPFVPDQFHYELNSAVFFVDSRRTAEAICALSKRITKKDGFKMLILMQRGGSAAVPLSEDTVTKLKVCMSKRYDPATKTLNLEKLYYDTDLSSEGIRMVLSRRTVMSSIINIIKENIPELTSLSLNSNKLYSVDLMHTLREAAPDLVRLDLGNNVIRSQSNLDALEGMNLVELRLAGNPLCDGFNDDAAYVSAVRKRLPKLTRLDGQDLPPPITFDIEAITKLPPTQGSFFLNDQVKTLVCAFLQQYYTIYDSSNRSALLEAYHEQVTFSMTYMFNRASSREQNDFSAYHRDSRNLKKLIDSGRRQKNLRCGRSNVMTLLSELPVTRHDPNSYVIDVNLASASMLNFTVHGLFEEVVKSGKGALRAFSRLFVAVPQGKLETHICIALSRLFVAVPQGSGVAIINEELFVTNPTSKQQENAFKNPTPTPVVNPTPGGSTVLPGATAGGVVAVTTDAQKEEMMQQFSLQSGMNNDWTKM